MIGNGLRRLLLATVFTGAAVFGDNAFGHVSMARADWDIEAFDACMRNMQSANPAAKEAYCCVWSGGDYHSGKCWAPVNNLAPPPGSTKPPPPGPLPTQIVVPVNPPPANNAG
jgi:hypothetical protein